MEGGHVRTFISFNQGQTWRLLTPPASEPHCSWASCSLHLHLRMSESPYSPDSITSSASAPGLVIATGTVGPELTNHNSRTFLSSDAGNTWTQVRYTPGHRIFGHLGHHSDWQLIKVDYSSLFSKRCVSADYQPWTLLNQREPCVMGRRQTFRKRRPGSRCMLGVHELKLLSSESCRCTPYDFEW
ncbi:hypothetical protein ACEWY4_020605 [Coilia grayii]